MNIWEKLDALLPKVDSIPKFRVGDKVVVKDLKQISEHVVGQRGNIVGVTNDSLFEVYLDRGQQISFMESELDHVYSIGTRVKITNPEIRPFFGEVGLIVDVREPAAGKLLIFYNVSLGPNRVDLEAKDFEALETPVPVSSGTVSNARSFHQYSFAPPVHPACRSSITPIDLIPSLPPIPEEFPIPNLPAFDGIYRPLKISGVKAMSEIDERVAELIINQPLFPANISPMVKIDSKPLTPPAVVSPGKKKEGEKD